ncbi:MAG: hypothetical protein PHR77_13370 [Kiritimatiellae bacterium]|nr:hypothetical protein [Kiritimatiellia bacterium]MDD5523025.1 hypothetical protein [Kiritimatiellia bacterium]
MKSYVWVMALVAGLAIPGVVWAQEKGSFEKEMQNMEIQKRQMDLQARQAEIEFQGEMRKLDLDKKRAELDKQREMMKMMSPRGPQMGRPGMPGGMPGCARMGGLGMFPGGMPGCPCIGGPGKPDGCPCGLGINKPDGGRPQCPGMAGLAGHGRHPAGHHRPCMGIFILVVAIIHILVAVWVSQDIRKRNSGSRIWVVLALLAGLVGTLVYAIVRLGDNKQA